MNQMSIESEFSVDEAIQHVTSGKPLLKTSKAINLTTKIAPEHQAKRKFSELRLSIDVIHAHASQHGLPPPTLTRLLDVITSPNLLDQTSQNALIECLYPDRSVSNDVINIVIGSLGHGVLKASYPSQQALLKWLVMVYDFLGDPGVLSRMYSVFFNLLDSMNLLTDLCCLLAKITRKKHVKPFRLQMLQDLLRKVGNDTTLLKLMITYDSFAPGVLDLGRSKKGKGGFAHPNPEWRDKLEQIHLEKQRNSTNGESEETSNGSGKPAKDTRDLVQRSDLIDDFIGGLSKPTSPDITISDLEDPLLQIRAALEPEATTMAKVNHVLSSLLDQELKKIEEHGQEDKHALSDVLEKSLAFTKSTKVLQHPLEPISTIY